MLEGVANSKQVRFCETSWKITLTKRLNLFYKYYCLFCIPCSGYLVGVASSLPQFLYTSLLIS